MERDIVFLAYADSMDDSLNYLKKEHRETKKALKSCKKKDDFILESHYGVTRDDIFNHLIDYMENLIVFQFSGHANQDTLLFEEEAADPKGIIKILAECPKLKLIILNGCSTKKHLDLVAKEKFKKSPIIISTNAKVKDQSAYKYATTFWKTMCEKNATVEKAHELGVASAKSLKNNIEINSTRNAAFAPFDELDVKVPLWDLSSISNKLNWKLPKKKRFLLVAIIKY